MWGMSLDTLQTARQFVKNLRVNWAYYHLMPTAFFDSVADISPSFLREHGISGLVWDVDNTLMKYHGTAVDAAVADAFRALSEKYPGVILSNSDDTRYRELGTIFPDMPVLRVYAPKQGSGKTALLFRQLAGQTSTLRDGDRGNGYTLVEESLAQAASASAHPFLRDFYALRKPHPLLFQYAAAVLGHDCSRIAVIGDRASTDISGGNQAGMYTIKVDPLRPETEPVLGMLGRWCEVGVMAWHAYRLRRA